MMLRANGLDFACDEAGSGDDVALCLHGFPESRFSWRYQLPVLAQAGWRAVAPDLRGYGQSSRPNGKAAYHIDHLVADVPPCSRRLARGANCWWRMIGARRSRGQRRCGARSLWMA